MSLRHGTCTYYMYNITIMFVIGMSSTYSYRYMYTVDVMRDIDVIESHPYTTCSTYYTMYNAVKDYQNDAPRVHDIRPCACT